MSTTTNTTSSGIGIGGLLTVIFVCAKVFGWQPVASWSWLWVLSPLWISFLVGMAILVIVLAVVLVGALIAYIVSD